MHLVSAMVLVLCMAGLVSADHMPNTLVVSIGESQDPVATLGTFTYTVNVLNSGPNKVTNMRVESTLPQGTELVQCSPTCTVANGTVTSTFSSVSANASKKQSILLMAPDTHTYTSLTISLSAKATATGAHAGDGAQSTTIAPDIVDVVLSSATESRTEQVSCGQTLTSAFFGFGSFTKVQLTASLGCAQTDFGLSVSASNVTLDLNGKKIVGDGGETDWGTIGVFIEKDAQNVTIRGGSTSGTSGIEYFDWCIKNEGENSGLVINQVRCFRARSAAIDIASNNVQISKSLIDNTIPSAGNTEELQNGGTGGGVGIRAHGDNISIKDTKVRRSKVVGIWASGSHTGTTGFAVNIEGNLTSALVETNYGIGIRLEGGPHQIKGVTISGEGFDKGTSTDGVVVEASGTGNVIDGISVKNHRGNGVVTHGSQTTIERTSIELVGGDGFLSTSTAIGTVLNGNSSKPKKNGYVIHGPDSVLTTNTAETAGENGFVVTGASADLAGNKSKSNKGDGYQLTGSGALLQTNGAEANTGRGYQITGSTNVLKSNSSKSNKSIGFNVPGPGSGNEFENSAGERNSSSEWMIGSGNIDKGNNSANGRTITFTTAGGTFE